MKILYVANFKDVHSAKWAEFFKNKELAGFNTVYKVHSDGFSFKTIWHLRKLIKDFQPDILHAQYCGSWALMAVLSGFRPLVMTVHGSEVLLSKGIKKKLVKWVMDKADLVTTDSTRIRDTTGATVIKFGVDIQKYQRTHAPDSPPLVLCRGGDAPIYDRQTFYDAMDIVRVFYPFVVSRVIEGIDPEEMPRLLNRASVFVSPALSDAGIASSIAEAMACELPIVASAVAENHEWLNSTQLFHKGNPIDLAYHIMDFLSIPGLREGTGLSNRGIIMHRNDYNTEMKKMLTLYEEITDERNK